MPQTSWDLRASEMQPCLDGFMGDHSGERSQEHPGPAQGQEGGR